MDCRQLRECVAPLLDGELEPELEARAAAHLEVCSECAALVEKLATIPVHSMAASPPQDPAFWDAMDQALTEEAERPEGPRRRLVAWLHGEVRLSRGVVLVYLALLGLAFAWHLLRDPTPTPASMAAQPQAVEPAPAPSEAPAPARPAARSTRKLEKASYEPVQQTF